ncbi:MAG: hypothetical protein ACI85I_001862, partial [Arenicella sp.]
SMKAKYTHFSLLEMWFLKKANEKITIHIVLIPIEL